MKKVIDGKLYDVDASTKIGSCGNDLWNNNFYSWEEILYKTKNGKYFIYGEGGPKTKYARSHGNSTSGSSDIWLVNSGDILEWLEENDYYFSKEDKYYIIEEIECEEG